MHINQATAHLKGPERRVVFMLNPELAAHFICQDRPNVLKCGVYVPVNNFLCSFKLGLRYKSGHGADKPFLTCVQFKPYNPLV